MPPSLKRAFAWWPELLLMGSLGGDRAGVFARRAMTRQAIWQQQNRDAGKCSCGQPKATGLANCLKHAVQLRENQRRYSGCKWRNNSKTYRLEAKAK